MKIETVTINADDARLMLADNRVNRRLSTANVAKMCADMTAGQWGVNPQPIMIGDDERLIDGQHRLHALIAADAESPGITLTVTIARGVPDSAFDVIDQGQPRSAAQALAIHGLPNTNVLAAAAGIVLRYERWPDRIWGGSLGLSKASIVAFVADTHDEVDQLGTIDHNLSRINIIPGTWTALHWLVIRHSKNRDEWDPFITGVITGADLRTDDPRLALRNRGRAISGWMRSQQGTLGIYLKTWNAYVDDVPVKLLRFKRDELPMPHID